MNSEMQLGLLVGGYVMATLVAEGYTADVRVWQGIQTHFLDELQKETGLPGDDVAALVERMSAELKAKIERVSNA